MDDRQRSVMELKDRIRHDDYRVDTDVVATAIVTRILSRAQTRRAASENVLETRELVPEAVERAA